MTSVDISDNLMTAIHQRNAMEVAALLDQWAGDVTDHMLNCAISYNAPEIVALLAPRAVGEHRDGLGYAVSLGHLDCVKVLTPHCSDDERKSALSNAVAHGHKRMIIVEYLALHCDVRSSYALWGAVLNEEHEIFEFLFPLSDPWWVLDEMRKHFQESPPRDNEHEYIAWFEQRMAEEQRKILLNEISDTAVVRVSKI